VAEAGWMTEKTSGSQPAAISFRWLAFNGKLANLLKRRGNDLLNR